VAARALTLGRHFTLTSTALTVSGAPSFTLWQRTGQRLDRIHGSLMWWLGDWAATVRRLSNVAAFAAAFTDAGDVYQYVSPPTV
jgi:hypothetical protein